MTVAEALAIAKGYAHCEDCEKALAEWGSHRTFTQPPKVTRAGKLLELPEDKAQWLKFELKASDKVEFGHVLF